MSDSGFGEGFGAAMIFGAILGATFVLGMLVEGSWIRSDCSDFEKVKIMSSWYVCKPMEPKK